jgi:restriction endonuclease S subunit
MGEFLPEYNKELPKSLEPKVGLEVNDGDFLVTTTGPRNRCGVVCRVRTAPRRLIFSGKILRFRADESQVLGSYLMYLLMSPDYQKVLDELKVGTSDSSVSIGNQQILDLEIPLASIDEQTKIVEILEEQLSRLDAALASVRAVGKKASRYRRSLLNAAFTGSLSGNDLNTGELPDGWKRVALGEVLEDAQSGFASGRHNSNGNGVVHMRPMNVSRSGNLDFSETKYVEDNSTRRLHRGDVLFNNTNSSALVGKTAFVDTDQELAFSNHMTRLRPDSSVMMARFLASQLHALWLNGFFEEICSNHVNQASVSINRLKEVEVNVPSLHEQESIVHVIEEQLSRLDAAIVIAEAIEKKTNALRRSLLHSAFNGELTKEWREGANV